LDIRLYDQHAHREACLSIFDSIPGTGREAFAQFLDSTPAHFWVIDLGPERGGVAACGGFDAAQGELRWGMVRNDLQRKGLGRFLLLFRLKELGKVPGLVSVRAVVPAAYARFYEKNGMKLASISEGEADFRMKLQVCSG
jgi:GNAT superfamily N-acetyltransferase